MSPNAQNSARDRGAWDAQAAYRGISLQFHWQAIWARTLSPIKRAFLKTASDDIPIPYMLNQVLAHVGDRKADHAV